MPQRERLVYKKGSLFLRLFGLPFLLMGLGAGYAGLQGKMKSESGEPTPPLTGVLISLPFVLAGAGLVFGRAGVVVDKRERVAKSWWGLLVPFCTKSFPLDSFNRVEIERKVLRDSESTSILFPVYLVGQSEKFACYSGASYENSIAKAEELAEFTKLELHDTTTGEAVVRAADSLDKSILQQVEKSGEALDWPELPEGSSIRYETVDDSAIINIPPGGFRAAYALLLLPAFLFVGFFLFNFLGPFRETFGNLPPVFRLVVAGFGALFVILPIGATLGPVLRMSLTREKITASWQGIQIERKTAVGFKKRWTIDGENLEALEISDNDPFASLKSTPSGVTISGLRLLSPVSRSRGIRVRSDKEIVTFGRTLPSNELQWLHAALRYILATRPGL